MTIFGRSKTGIFSLTLKCCRPVPASYQRRSSVATPFWRDLVRQPLWRFRRPCGVSLAVPMPLGRFLGSVPRFRRPCGVFGVVPRPWRRCLGPSRGRPALVKYSSNRNCQVMTTLYPPARPARGTRGCSGVPQPVQQTGLGVACPLWRVVLAGRSLPSFPPLRGRQRRHPQRGPPGRRT